MQPSGKKLTPFSSIVHFVYYKCLFEFLVILMPMVARWFYIGQRNA